MCLVLKLDNGQVVSIAYEQTVYTDTSSNALVYRFPPMFPPIFSLYFLLYQEALKNNTSGIIKTCFLVAQGIRKLSRKCITSSHKVKEIHTGNSYKVKGIALFSSVMGLYEVTSVGSLRGLRIVIMVPCFHLSVLYIIILYLYYTIHYSLKVVNIQSYGVNNLFIN